MRGAWQKFFILLLLIFALPIFYSAINRVLFSSPNASQAEVIQALEAYGFDKVLDALDGPYPDAHDDMNKLLMALLYSDDINSQAASAPTVYIQRFLREKMPFIPKASDKNLRDVIQAHVEMIEEFSGSPMTCNAFLTQGSSSLNSDEKRRLGKTVNTFLAKSVEAAYSGETKPEERSQPDASDYQNLRVILLNQGLDEQRIYSVLNLVNNDLHLCKSYITFFRSMALAEFDGAHRIRAFWAESILGEIVQHSWDIPDI